MTLQPPPRSSPPPMLDLPPAPRVDWPPRAHARKQSSKTGLIIAIGGGGLVLAAGLVTVLAIVIGGAVSRHAEQRAALRDLEGQSEQMRASALQQLDSENGLQIDSAGYERYMQNAEKTADKLGGPEGAALRSGLNVVRDFQQEAVAYQALIQRIMTEGSVDPSGITSQSIIDQRLKLVRQADAANQKLTQSIRTLAQRYRTELLKSNVDAKSADASVRGFEAGAKINLLLEIREEDRKVYACMTKIFELLKREWSRWNYDRASQMVRFNNDKALQDYNQLISELQQAAEHQTSLQRQYLTSQSAGSR